MRRPGALSRWLRAADALGTRGCTMRNSTFACHAASVRYPAKRRAARHPRLSFRIARLSAHFPFPRGRSVPVQTH
ncbi:hypothetical protein ACVK00_000759 [Burkholderia sp. PvR073]